MAGLKISNKKKLKKELNLRAFLNKVNRSSERDRLIFLTLFETGCTASELASIKVKDCIRPKDNVSLHKITFHNPTRNSAIDEDLGNKIFAHIISSKKSSENYLFSSKKTPFSVKRIEQLTSEILDCITPQQIRYLHIIHAAKTGLSLDSIALQTGLKKQRIMQILDAEKIQQIQSYSRFFENNNIQGE